MILPRERDSRLITIRRGGTLTDAHHHLLALWAAECAEHVLPLFEAERPHDRHPREAIEMIRAWVRGEVPMTKARTFAFAANASARGLDGAAKFAALSAGQAVAVAHVAAHDLGAAAYAIRAPARRRPMRPTRRHIASVTGSGSGCPAKSAPWFSTTRRSAAPSAGTCSIRPATRRSRATSPLRA